ncbi:MAG TPA: DNA replication and repair protein RecF [Candidatus Saccharimonadia bacterium]|nr:DNA replication and repair protein RecF [Candidatus Saccharimonadia bacterium]
MRLSSLSLQHFRNYAKRSFEFSPHATLLVGENARGKTNILEAISLVSTGESFRAQKIEEMVEWKHEVGRIKLEIQNHDTGDQREEIEIVLTTGMVQNERAQKRKFLVDGAARQKKSVVGSLTSVLFRPEDMDLIAGSPSTRRRFLDTVLSQSDREYRESLDSYEKALIRRNALLVVLREGNTTRSAFSFWDQLLVKHGNILSEKRREFIEFLNARTDFPMTFRVEYEDSTISEHRLHQYAVEEVAAGHTLVGPHKDDIITYLKNGEPNSEKELSSFGSRGEQRMAVLWLKTGELDFLEQKKQERPILLLDDIFSELDERHQQMVLELIDRQQTILTSTKATLPKALGETVEYVEL